LEYETTPRRAGVEADAPAEPVGAALRALLAPALSLVELADAGEEAVRCRIQVRGEGADLVRESVERTGLGCGV